jgi:hypothetical protein
MMAEHELPAQEPIELAKRVQIPGDEAMHELVHDAAVPIPAASRFDSWEAMASVTNSSFVHLSFVSDCLRTVQGVEI